MCLGICLLTTVNFWRSVLLYVFYLFLVVAVFLSALVCVYAGSWVTYRLSLWTVEFYTQVKHCIALGMCKSQGFCWGGNLCKKCRWHKRGHWVLRWASGDVPAVTALGRVWKPPFGLFMLRRTLVLVQLLGLILLWHLFFSRICIYLGKAVEGLILYWRGLFAMCTRLNIHGCTIDCLWIVS